MRALVVVTLGLVLSGCQSPDERKLAAMVERRVAQTNLQIAEIGEPYIYRDPSDDARMACLTIRLKNQWGELQPEQRVIAWYIPRVDDWFTDNFRPADDGLTCEEYVDPRRIAAERASEAAAQQARMAEDAARQAEQNAQWQRRMAQEEKTQRQQYETQQRESEALEAERARNTEAEFQRRQREADATLRESLENGPSNH